MKILNSITALAILSIVLVSCKKEETIYGFDIQSRVSFSIYNEKGEDMLNPNTENHIKESEIRVYSIIEGEKVLQYNSDMDYPYSINAFKDESGVHRVRVGCNMEESEDRPMTIIQWDRTDENNADTVESHYYRDEYMIQQDSVWLNGELVWIRNPDGDLAYFDLIK